MNRETGTTSTPLSALLSAAREVMKPRWPKPDVISYHLPGERDVSRTPTRIILWPGYGKRIDLHGLLYFRAGTLVPVENAEYLELMLDSKSLLTAAVIHRMLTTTYAPPDAVRKLASDIIMRKHPLNVPVESRPESTSHSIDITVFQAGDASLHMFAEVRQEMARVSWQAVTQNSVRSISDISGAIAVSDVCRTPHEALTLKMRLDTIIPYCRGDR
jgi:hypothetical protein